MQISLKYYLELVNKAKVINSAEHFLLLLNNLKILHT